MSRYHTVLRKQLAEGFWPPRWRKAPAAAQHASALSPGAFPRRALEDWITAHYFSGATRDQLEGKELECLAEMVAYLQEKIGLKLDETAASPFRAKCLLRDSFFTFPRPLCLTLMTAFAAATGTQALLPSLGFQELESGSVRYWVRIGVHRRMMAQERKSIRPRQWKAGVELEYTGGVRKAYDPLVVLPGFGSGMLLFSRLIAALEKNFEETDVFVICPPKQAGPSYPDGKDSEDAPLPGPWCACISDILQMWGHLHAHFFAQSYGTVMLTWILRRVPSIVSRVTLLDPVCFATELRGVVELRMRRAKLHNAGLLEQFWDQWATTELGLASLLHRQIDPFETVLRPEHLQNVPTLIILMEDDMLVDTRKVQVLLAHAQQQRTNPERPMIVRMMPGSHGSALLHADLRREIADSVQQFHDGNRKPVNRFGSMSALSHKATKSLG